MLGHPDLAQGCAELLLGITDGLLLLCLVLHWTLQFHVFSLVNTITLAAIFSTLHNYLAGVERLNILFATILIRIPDRASSNVTRI
jgi:hypothetical protein